jgi:hypothetical protein
MICNSKPSLRRIFLAAIEAFLGRGHADDFGSHDLEDFIKSSTTPLSTASKR